MELKDDELLIRRKRIDANGDWEYECRSCELWLLKSKFRGCVEYIDAYGNCLMCSSCRVAKGQIHHKESMRKELNIMLNNLGYDTSGEVPIYIQFHKKHNLKLKRRDM
jgi:hypothetical protein